MRAAGPREELLQQKQNLEPLLQFSPAATVLTDLEATVVAWNPAAEKLFGYTAQEAVGRKLDDLVAATEDLHRAAQAFTKAVGKERVDATTRRTRKDGTFVDVELRAAPLLVNGKAVGTFGVYHDITELQHQKRYYESLLEVSPTPVVSIDPEGRVTSWNPAAERLFGYTPEEAIGQHIDDLVANRDELREEALDTTRRIAEEQVSFVARRTRKDGSLVDVQVTGAPVHVGGELVGMYGFFNDITELQEQKRFYESLVELSPTAIVVTGLDWTVKEWNPAAERLFGYTPEEAIGRNLDDLVVKREDLQQEAADFSRAAADGERTKAFTRRTRKDGSLIDVEIVSEPIDVAGKRVGFLAIYHDVTELQRQKQYYASVLELSPAAIVMANEDFFVKSWNPMAEKLFGYTAEEAIGKFIDDLVANSPEIRQEAAAQNERGARGLGARIITRRTRKDGSLVDVEMSAAPVYVGEERVGHSVVYHDISEIQRQRRYYEALVQSSPIAIALLDPQGTVTSWNPSAERLFGYSAEEAVGENIDDLVAGNEEIREEAIGLLHQGMGGDLVHWITRRTRKDGSMVDVEIFGAPVIVGDEPAGLYAMYHDITELQEARKAAEAAAEAKSAFLATMSHEIRTPLNAVIGMTGLLLDTELTSEQRGYSEVIRSSGDALLAVINEILDFSKIEAGRLDLEQEPFSVRQCLESALELVAASAAEKGLDLAYLIDPQTPRSIVGDVTRVRQILLNLLNNAVKFTDQGEVVLKVDARLADTGDGGGGRYEVHFAVRDTGIGIPEDRMEALFEAFSQVDASTTRRYGGTGLGLAISKGLAEQMGGSLSAESTPGQGSTFHVTIAAQAAGGPSDEVAGVPQLEGRRVLIVDDNATNREILRRQAEAWGMKPVDTEFPVTALEWVAQGDPFDLAILDMQMPDMDGLTLARAIRSHRDASRLPLVLLTSLGRGEQGETEIDFAARLTKPIRPSQLHDVLVEILAPQVALQHFPTPTPGRGVERELPPLRILIAEDNAVNQRVALLVLGKLGYRADVAGNGREAIQALERQPYDVILMDVQMPEMDGLEATREIRKRWPGGERRPRIIAMTAGATEDDRRACLAAGMDDYVSKPIRQEDLATALARSGTGSTLPGPPLQGDALDRLREAVGGEEAVADLVRTFLDDTTRLLTELRVDLQAGRDDDVRRHAHTLKSTSASFGAETLAELSRRLENLAGAESRGRLTELVGEIAVEFGRVSTALSDEGPSDA